MNKIFILFTAVILCFNVYGDDQIDKAQEYYDLGKELLENGDYEKANKAFTTAQEILDADSSGQDILQAQKSVDVPEPKQYDQQENIDNTIAAAIAIAAGDTRLALKHYIAAIEQYPDSPDIYYNAAVLCLTLKDYDQAGDFFKEVIRLDRKDANAYYNLGVLNENYFANYRKATAFYEEFLKYASDKEDKEEIAERIQYIKRHTN
jgi:tetratricopeptide (TPR) repeat protein